jgi:carbon-monoxide dehydrogenase medium subunit
LLTEIRVPRTGGAGWSFQKFNRRAHDWAIVGVVAVRTGTEGNGNRGGVRVALVNMASTPVRATAVEEALAGGASAAEAAAYAADGLNPPNDINANPEFRRHLAQVLVRRALEEAGV